ncbi:thioredoxin fold domain-containing protein [Fulvivirgaceae bacterium BMA12]|uniref:Thioredoxin fold domain-containing protein n=1 Tax=Agaribacillus aureus TaxID=3051825 RepID=A0ABT8KZ39_9BACT|nr:thioredoxin fold domain-containing protein [Fulvivirgaceae bacterium BMA12]
MMFKNKVLLGIATLVVLVAFINAGSSVQSNTNETAIKWVDIEEAQRLGKSEPRKVFVDVYTDWCGWCKKMDRSTFADESVVNYVNDNYYAVKLNAESSKKIKFNGKEMTEAYLARSMRVSGYPTIVFIDEKFESIQPIPGYRTAAQFRRILQDFNKN